MHPDEFPEPLLAEVVAGRLGMPAADLRLRRCPTGKFNTTYFVDGGPRPLVLRIAPPDDPAQMLFYERRMMHQEPALLALLRSRTSVPVPAVIAFEPHQPQLGRDCLLLERLPGWPLSDHPTLTGHAFGEVLREVGASFARSTPSSAKATVTPANTDRWNRNRIGLAPLPSCGTICPTTSSAIAPSMPALTITGVHKRRRNSTVNAMNIHYESSCVLLRATSNFETEAAPGEASRPGYISDKHYAICLFSSFAMSARPGCRRR